MNESQIIRIAETFFTNKVSNYIGDDTAILEIDNDAKMLFSTDMLVENVHFSQKIEPHAIGWKSLAVNLSDIAAMGGTPFAALLSLGLPDSIDKVWVKEFFQGLHDCSSEFKCPIVGGDTVHSENIIVNIAILGSSNNPISRSGINSGDYICVSGHFGASAGGLYCIQNEIIGFDTLIQKHKYPSPRIEMAKNLATSIDDLKMMDSSDGLVSSCITLAQKNQLGFEIHWESIPVIKELLELGKATKQKYMDWVLFGGEEYELVYTIPSESFTDIHKEHTIIGQMTSRVDYRLKIDVEYLNLKEYDKSFQHFRK